MELNTCTLRCVADKENRSEEDVNPLDGVVRTRLHIWLGC